MQKLLLPAELEPRIISSRNLSTMVSAHGKGNHWVGYPPEGVLWSWRENLVPHATVKSFNNTNKRLFQHISCPSYTSASAQLCSQYFLVSLNILKSYKIHRQLAAEQWHPHQQVLKVYTFGTHKKESVKGYDGKSSFFFLHTGTKDKVLWSLLVAGMLPAILGVIGTSTLWCPG